MKKLISILLLSGSLWLTGCGDSNNDFQQVSGQQGNPGPIVTPTPQPTAGYFVDATNGNDATAAAAANPTDETPFQTIQAAVADAPENATITVRAGSYTGAISLKNGQRLLGTPGGTRPALVGPIVLADGNTVDFLRIAGTTDNAIDGDDQTGGTITNCQFADTTNFGNALQAISVRGTWTVENNTISNMAGIGIDITVEAGDIATAFVNNNTISGNDFNALAFQAEDDGQLRVQANDNVMTGNQATFTFEVITLDTGVVTLQIIGNENDDVYRFSRTDATSAINVENFGDLETLNTGDALVDLLPVNDIDDAGF